jgi:hypothetical protein
MRRATTNGICTYCNTEISKNSRSILSHFLHCHGRHVLEGTGSATYVLLLIQPKNSPHYWLVVKARSDVSMKTIDKFLRDIWLECCGHLSEFSYKNAKIPMTRHLTQVISKDLKIDYVYDFGSSTELTLSIIQTIQDVDEGHLLILVRNRAPEYECSSCNKRAVAICPYCIDDGEGFLCQSCSGKHRCVQEEGYDLLSPLINSPRCGVCGYTGSIDKKIKKYFPKDIL